MIKFIKKTIVAALAFLPLLSFAQIRYNTTGGTRTYGSYGGGGSGGLWNLFFIVMDFLSQAVIILISLAVVFFLYGILKYISRGDDEESQKKGKNIMIFGIIGLFVMISFWGIVNILINTFELDTTPYVDVPYFDSSGSGSGSADENWKDLEYFYGGSEGE
ncbi:MAG: hypothetical protein UW04_C0019G0008 [Parcubacteria group bacterium GW2011_GWB1_43_8]|nr:MAG: hypothetical protein UW04_C0019G0008 [Parcubacteria group bacterium GW2011_GWB1_43_8]